MSAHADALALTREVMARRPRPVPGLSPEDHRQLVFEAIYSGLLSGHIQRVPAPPERLP